MKKVIFAIAVLGILGAGAIIGTTQTANACGWLSACDPDTTNINSFAKEAALTEVNQRKLLTAQPVPSLEKSNERANLIKRLTRFNDPAKVSYIYLVNYGKVMAFYTIKGKVSSVSSQLTDPTQLINADGSPCGSYHQYDASGCAQVASPDLDGSYGTNGDAIFFFTTDDTYVEWHGDYMLVDQPLQLTTQPELVRAVK